MPIDRYYWNLVMLLVVHPPMVVWLKRSSYLVILTLLRPSSIQNFNRARVAPHPLFQGLIKAALDLQKQRIFNGNEPISIPVPEQTGEHQQEFASAISA